MSNKIFLLGTRTCLSETVQSKNFGEELVTGEACRGRSVSASV